MVNEINLNYLYCIKCSHSWIPRGEKVFVCPKCKNPRWNEFNSPILRVSRNLSPKQILEVISKNIVLSNELRQIGMVNHGR